MLRRLRSFAFELDVFGQFIEISALGESDDELGVDLLFVFEFNVFAGDGFDNSKSVFGEDLCELGNEGDGLTHAFDLDRAVFFHDEFTQEKTLIESAVFSDSVDVGFGSSLVGLGHLMLNKKSK
jgi:hypothetical protein